MSEWIPYRCPVCKGVLGEVLVTSPERPRTVARIRTRCRKRLCSGKPRVVFEIITIMGAAHVNARSMDVDRRRPVVVE